MNSTVSRLGLWSRIARLLPIRRRPVGSDLDGNKYYEIPNPNGGKMKRTVEYRVERDIADYTEGARRLPVQWTTWLSHTRTTAPTLEELQADANRQHQLGSMIKAIEERERAERIRQGYLIEGQDSVETAPQIAGPSRANNGWTKANQPYPFNNSATTPESSGQPNQLKASYPSAPGSKILSDSVDSKTSTYPIRTWTSKDVAPSRETVEPMDHHSAEELRRLSMEDTKRRIKESVVKVDLAGQEGAGPDSGGLQPRRRGRN